MVFTSSDGSHFPARKNSYLGWGVSVVLISDSKLTEIVLTPGIHTILRSFLSSDLLLGDSEAVITTAEDVSDTSQNNHFDWEGLHLTDVAGFCSSNSGRSWGSSQHMSFVVSPHEQLVVRREHHHMVVTTQDLLELLALEVSESGPDWVADGLHHVALRVSKHSPRVDDPVEGIRGCRVALSGCDHVAEHWQLYFRRSVHWRSLGTFTT